MKTKRLVAARSSQPFAAVRDLAHRAQLTCRDLEALAGANALAMLSGNRHQAAWATAGVDRGMPLFQDISIQEGTPMLRVPTEPQNVVADYRSFGLTLGRHPLALLRDWFMRRRVLTVAELHRTEADTFVRVAGLVTIRQTPGTANNVSFFSLEDETGTAQLIVFEHVAKAYRMPFMQAELLETGGKLQRDRGSLNVIVEDMVDRRHLLVGLNVSARNFH